MMSAANAAQYYRSSAAAAAQMRSVYNPAGNNYNNYNNDNNNSNNDNNDNQHLQACLALAVTTASWGGLKTPGAPCLVPL